MKSSRTKLGIYRKILFALVFFIPIWFFLFMLSYQLLNTEYEYLIGVLVVIGLPIIIIGGLATPFLDEKIREEDVKGLVEKVKDWEPVIMGRLSIRGKTLDSVYDKTVEWLESVDADIHKNDSPNSLLAFHEIYDSNFKGIGISSRIENREKFFEFSLTEAEGYVRIIMEIHQGSLRTSLDRYEKRKQIWPQFVEEYSSYSGAVIESIDGTLKTTDYESRISMLYMLLGSPFGIYLSLLGVVLIAVYIWGPAVINVNNTLIFIGLVFILGLFAFYRTAKSW